MSNLQIEDVYTFEGTFDREDNEFCFSLPNQNSLGKFFANAPRRSRSTPDINLSKQESQTSTQTATDKSIDSLLSKLRKAVNTKKGTKSYLTIPLLNEANHLIDLIESNINELRSQISSESDNEGVASACVTCSTKTQPPEQINEAIQTSPTTSRTAPNNAKKSFAEALKGNLPKQRPSAILLYPKEKDSFEGPLREFLSEEVPSSHSIFKNVRKLKKIKNNGIAVIVNNKLQQQEFLEELQNIPSIQTKVSSILPAVKHPSAILYNIPNNVKEEEIQKELKTVTHQESNLKVRFKFKGRDENSTNWVFETPGEALKLLKKTKKLHINWHTVEIREFFHVKKCNFCQGYGHVTKNCPCTKPICGKCTGPHATFKCRRNVLICVNCSEFNKVHQTNHSIYHKAHSSACFCYSTEVTAYKKTRDYV